MQAHAKCGEKRRDAVNPYRPNGQVLNSWTELSILDAFMSFIFCDLGIAVYSRS